MNRVHARWSRFGADARGFVSAPEPRTIGSFARGRQLCSGAFLFAGHLVEARDTPIWELPAPDPAFTAELHGFTWLDDLMAAGDAAAQERAQAWTHGWVQRYGAGAGPGWVPDLAGRRLIRWINHSVVLLNGRGREDSAAFFRTLARQTLFLARRWKAASPGLPRFEALTGLIYAGLSLEGMEAHVEAACTALARECRAQIDAEGGIPTRNPEELLEVFTLLNWAAVALSEAGRPAPQELLAAIARVAPTLRALRHADGGLARFHGGGRGLEGRLDQALATSGVRSVVEAGLSMGFARISFGRTSVILDAAAPPFGPASVNAHASTLAFELTSGRRPLIVNCGSGATFGPDWRQAGRATASHSTLTIEGFSSARLGGEGGLSDRTGQIVDGPRDVRLEFTADEAGAGIVVGHDGYLASHGLTHIRHLNLGYDGRTLHGEDTVAAIEKPDERLFDRALDRTRLRGIPFTVRFHLHPDVDCALDLGGSAVSMALRSGEIWIFRPAGKAHLSIEPSVYLEKGRLQPRATKQVVLTASAMNYATRVSWTLSKAQDSPLGLRDLNRDELALT